MGWYTFVTCLVFAVSVYAMFWGWTKVCEKWIDEKEMQAV